MKKHPVFLLLFFTLNASIIYMPAHVESKEGCPGPFLPPTPCIGDMFNMIGQKRPISYSCCAVISEVSNNCPNPFRPWWFFEAEKNCIQNEVITPPAPSGDMATPPPTPPSDNDGDIATPPPPDQPKGSESPPPPYRNNETCPDISRLYVPCHEQIDAYYEHNVPISPSCCALIIEVHDKCSPRDWSDTAIKCHDYCLNHH